jgi:hypothetical protein
MAAIPIASFAVDYELEAKSAVKKNSCPMKNDEELVCAVIMCDFGALMGEYPSECHKVKLDFAVYLATLGFWDKPPKCFMRDSECNKNGKASKKTQSSSLCENPATGKPDEACLKGLNVYNMDCDEFEDKKQRDQCYLSLAQANGECEKLGGVAALKCSTGFNPESTVYSADLQARSYCKSVKKIAVDPVQLEKCIVTMRREYALNECDSHPPATFAMCRDGIFDALNAY